MMINSSLQIGPFRLDPVQGLSVHGREVHVTPKSLAVLATLARQQGRIVTRQELFRTVWSGTLVTEAALSSCISELRRAMDDDARNPRYIETVHRRGFRLLANGTHHVEGDRNPIPPLAFPLLVNDLPGSPDILERLTEMTVRVQNAGMEIAFITGPSGIGKQVVLNQFAAQISGRDDWLVCSAVCEESGEAYGPLVDILAQLSCGAAGAHITNVLRQYARSWLAELPAVQYDTEQNQPETGSGATAECRFRELGEALAVFTRGTPLLVCLEDLHKCDEETLDFLVRFAGDHGDARILWLASWQGTIGQSAAPCSSAVNNLRSVRQFSEFELERLSEKAVAELLQNRFPETGSDSMDRTAEEIYQRTGGCPLLISNALEGLAGAQAGTRIAATRMTRTEGTSEDPLGTAQLEFVQQQLELLDESERSVLEAASVLGKRISVAQVAEITGRSAEDVADVLGRIQDKSYLIAEQGGHNPMKTQSSCRYTFISGRYRTDVLDQLSIPRRTEFHRRAGAWLKNNPGQDPHGNVPRLARHFEQAGELEEASRYWYEAGAIARRQGSHQIALKNFRRAQVLHKALAPSPGRELEAAIICSALGREIVVTEGLNAPDANRLFRRAFELSQDVPDSPELAQVLWRLWVFQLSRGPLESAQELAGRLLNIARRMESPEILVAAHHAGWGTAFMQGDLPRVQEHTRECIAVCGSGLNGSSTLTNGCTLHDAHLSDHNIAICGGFFSAWVDAISGEKERASKSLDAVIAHARDIRHPFTLALALAMSAGALASSGNSGLTRLRADECRSIARRHGFYALAAWSAIYSGWALVQLGDAEEGISLLEDGLTAAGKFGLRLFRPFHLALAAEAQIRCNRLGEASKSLAEAFSVSERSGHRFGLSELYRLRGELNLMIAGEKDSRPKAVRDLQAAVDIAAASGASCWEERARAKLSRVSELHASSL